MDQDVERIETPQVLEECKELDVSLVFLHVGIDFVLSKIVC